MAITYLDKPTSNIEYLDQPDPSYTDKAMGVLKSVAPAVSPLDAISTVQDLIDPAAKARAMFPKAGGAIAEYLGGKNLLGNPQTAAAIGLPVAIAPEIASSALGLAETLGIGGMGQGNLAKAIRNTPKTLGEQYAAQDEIAKISGELPVRAGKLPGYPKSSADVGNMETAKNLMLNPPDSYPKDPAALLNFAKNRMKAFGSELTNQELSDYYKMMKGLLTMGKNRLESMAGEGSHAIASGLAKQSHDLMAQGVNQALEKTPYWPQGFEPTRESLDQVYGISKKLRIGPEIAAKIWQYLGPKARLVLGKGL